jgi:hypothetical protein
MYKDFLFRYLFTNKTTLRHLYNALKQTSCGPDTPLTITTLHEALSSSRRNDLSFTIQDRYKVVIFIEHQSTANANMPLRFLFPGACLLWDSIVDKKAIYRQKRIGLPWPEFYVFILGGEEYPAEEEMRLSDAFEGGKGRREEANLELKVKVYNISKGKNTWLEEACPVLKGYRVLVEKIEEYEGELVKGHQGEIGRAEQRGILQEAVKRGMLYCIGNNILKEELMALKEKEKGNVLWWNEWNWEDAAEVAREEGLEEGWEKGMEKGMEKMRASILDLMRKGYTADQIEQMLTEQRSGMMMA